MPPPSPSHSRLKTARAFRFLDLPAELRLEIIDYYLADIPFEQHTPREIVKIPLFSIPPPVRRGIGVPLKVLNGYCTEHMKPALLRVSRQVRKEALEPYYARLDQILNDIMDDPRITDSVFNKIYLRFAATEWELVQVNREMDTGLDAVNGFCYCRVSLEYLQLWLSNVLRVLRKIVTDDWPYWVASIAIVAVLIGGVFETWGWNKNTAELIFLLSIMIMLSYRRACISLRDTTYR